MTKEDFMKRIELGKESSMIIWQPKLNELPIPKIKTKIIPLRHDILEGWIRDKNKMPDSYWLKMDEAIKQVGGYPVFMRTDQSSMKHSWKNTCYVQSATDLQHNVSMLLEEHEMANMGGELTYDAIVFREFIPLESTFTCFNSNFPVNKEVRCFIKNGQVQSLRHYWIKGAIESGSPDVDDWEIKLEKLKELSKHDIEEIEEQLLEVCKVFKEYWSVDFAKSKEGIWYLIDMARGEVSYKSDEIIWEQQNIKSDGGSES